MEIIGLPSLYNPPQRRLILRTLMRVPHEPVDSSEPDGHKLAWRYSSSYVVMLTRTLLSSTRYISAHCVCAVVTFSPADWSAKETATIATRGIPRSPPVGIRRDAALLTSTTHPPSAALAELRRVSPFARIQLVGLPLEDVQRLLASSSQRQVPRPIAELVHHRTLRWIHYSHMRCWLVGENLVDWSENAFRATGGAQSLAARIPEGSGSGMCGYRPGMASVCHASVLVTRRGPTSSEYSESATN